MEFYIVNSYYDTLLQHSNPINNKKHILLQNYTSIQWLSKYRTSGEFSIECVDTEENKKIEVGQCLYRSDKKMFAIIEEVSFEEGKIVFKGHFDALDKVVNKVPLKITDIAEGVKLIFQNNLRGFLKYQLAENSATRVIEPLEIAYDSLLEILEKLCKNTDLGFRMMDTYTVQLYEGKRLKNTVLSDEIGNIIEQSLFFDNVDAKNKAIVVGEDENEKEVIVEVENPNNKINIKTYSELYVDGSSIKKKYKDTAGKDQIYTDKQFKELLRQKGLTELLKHTPIEEYSCEVNESNFDRIYGVDYFEGDILLVRSKKYRRQMEMRIAEVKEIWESAYENKKRVMLTLETM